MTNFSKIALKTVKQSNFQLRFSDVNSNIFETVSNLNRSLAQMGKKFAAEFLISFRSDLYRPPPPDRSTSFEKGDLTPHAKIYVLIWANLRSFT